MTFFTLTKVPDKPLRPIVTVHTNGGEAGTVVGVRAALLKLHAVSAVPEGPVKEPVGGPYRQSF